MYLNTEVQPVHLVDYSRGSGQCWALIGVYQFDAIGKLEVPLHVEKAILHLRAICASAPAHFSLKWSPYSNHANADKQSEQALWPGALMQLAGKRLSPL